MTFSPRNFDPLTPLTPKFCCTNTAFSPSLRTHAHVLQNFYTIWVRGVTCQKQRLGSNLEGAGLGEHVKIWDPQFISAIVKLTISNLVCNLGLGSSLSRNNFYDQNLQGSGLGKYPKIGTPYLFLQLLKLATSHLVYKLGLGSSLPKKLLGPKLAGVRARGASQIIWNPLFISATVEATNFKFGIQLGLGGKLANYFYDQNWLVSGLEEHPKNLGPPIYF